MEHIFQYLALALPFLFIAYKLWSQTKLKQHRKKLPPSPFCLPIIGHLHLLKQPLHRSFHTLSQKYGPIISLWFGSCRVVIISSPSAVEDCLAKNDTVFANRPVLTVGKLVQYNCTTLSSSSYGDLWRNLRRISAVEVFSSNRLNGFVGIRRDEIRIFLNKLYSASGDDFAKVELRPMFMELTFNVIMRMVAGKTYYGEDVSDKGDAEAKQFRQLICEILEHAGASYLGDFLPVLRWIDYQGFLKKLRRLGKHSDTLLRGLIEEHRHPDKGSFESRNTMISHLLSLQESQPEEYSDEIIKGLILDIVFAATDTSAITLEWVMSNLLNHPEVLEKATKELEIKIGHQNLIDENDLSKLSYLQDIISETSRLYPAIPLLLPHLSSQECSVGEYHVEPNTMLLVNAWTIHRQPELWDDADKFKPERFQASTNNNVYKLMPFGLGRRSCPGMGLANRVVGFALGSLIQCFEWKRISDEEIDMSEGIGLTMPKAEPLQAMCKARDVMKKAYQLNSDNFYL